jgi:hypothetical protein
MAGTLQLSRALADRQLADAVLDQASRTPSRCWAPGNSADTPHRRPEAIKSGFPRHRPQAQRPLLALLLPAVVKRCKEQTKL